MAKDLNKFENEFIFFCKRICPQNCDMIHPKPTESKTDVIIDCCPIIRWEIFLCDKYDIDIDVKQRVEDILLSGKWKTMRK